MQSECRSILEGSTVHLYSIFPTNTSIFERISSIMAKILMSIRDERILEKSAFTISLLLSSLEIPSGDLYTQHPSLIISSWLPLLKDRKRIDLQHFLYPRQKNLLYTHHSRQILIVHCLKAL